MAIEGIVAASIASSVFNQALKAFSGGRPRDRRLDREVRRRSGISGVDALRFRDLLGDIKQSIRAERTPGPQRTREEDLAVLKNACLDLKGPAAIKICRQQVTDIWDDLTFKGQNPKTPNEAENVFTLRDCVIENFGGDTDEVSIDQCKDITIEDAEGFEGFESLDEILARIPEVPDFAKDEILARTGRPRPRPRVPGAPSEPVIRPRPTRPRPASPQLEPPSGPIRTLPDPRATSPMPKTVDEFGRGFPSDPTPIPPKPAREPLTAPEVQPQRTLPDFKPGPAPDVPITAPPRPKVPVQVPTRPTLPRQRVGQITGTQLLSVAGIVAGLGTVGRTAVRSRSPGRVAEPGIPTQPTPRRLTQRLSQRTRPDECVCDKEAPERPRTECFEGYFQEFPTDSDFSNWRLVDCITRQTIEEIR